MISREVDLRLGVDVQGEVRSVGLNIYIDERLCKGCLLCIDFCPQGRKGKIVLSKPRSQIGGKPLPVVVNENNCLAILKNGSACRICEMICPDLAISIE